MSTQQLPTEQEVADALGEPRKSISGLRTRHLTKDVHWTHGKQGAVLYLPEGTARLQELLEGGHGEKSGGPGDEPEGDEKSGAEAKKDPPWQPPPREPEETLWVQRLPLNNRVIICTDKKGRDRIRVCVGNSTNFREGMEIRARHKAGDPDPDCFELVGRLPRFPGRW